MKIEAGTEWPSIHERMIAILDELKPIGKTQRNEQQKFMFRGHDDILNALNPLLAKHGVLVVPDVLERVTAQRTTASDKVMFEVNLHVRYRFYGAAGDMVEASTWGEGTDMGDKATNKAMTMAFKNVLNQAFAISSAEFSDPDGATPDETVARGNGATTGGSSSSPRTAQPAAGAASSHPQAGSAAPAFNPPEDVLGLQESRADRVPPDDGGEPGAVLLTFGKHKGKRVRDAPEAYLEWWLKQEPPGSPELRRQRAAVEMFLGRAPAGQLEDPDVPFAWLDGYALEPGVYRDPWRR